MTIKTEAMDSTGLETEPKTVEDLWVTGIETDSVLLVQAGMMVMIENRTRDAQNLVKKLPKGRNQGDSRRRM